MRRVVAILMLLLLPVSNPAWSQVGAKKSGDERVKKLLEDAEIKYEVDKDGDFKLINEVNDGRTQLVFVLSETSKLGTLEIRQLWSVAYRSKDPFPALIANRLLEANSEVKLGAWQTLKMGNDYLAIFSAQVAADTDRRSLLLALHAVTTTADEIEKELTGKDDF